MFEEKHFYEWDVEINNCTQFFPVFFLLEPIRFTVCSKKNPGEIWGQIIQHPIQEKCSTRKAITHSKYFFNSIGVCG
jgi:hypothetical protein